MTFQKIVNLQIDIAREILCTKWYDALRSLFANAQKKKTIPDESRPIALNRFFDCVASQMTQCLQDIAVRNLKEFTRCFGNNSNLRIKLHILMMNSDRLVFSPTFTKIHNEILHIVENIAGAVQNFARIETTIKPFNKSFARKRYLCPTIPTTVIDECRRYITSFLEEERILPELLLHDFDDYIDLINGSAAESVYNFLEKNPEFDVFCDLVNHYSDIEYEISMNVWGIISVGLYEFHRTMLIQTLESLAKFIQTELLRKMINDQQAVMIQLQHEYERISNTALSIPLNTRELMASKEYVEKMQSEIIPEMEKRLKMVFIFDLVP